MAGPSTPLDAAPRTSRRDRQAGRPRPWPPAWSPLEFGSDIGGSIRVPASFCGVYGHKPSYDLVPQRGHTPPGTWTAAAALSGVVGPMARSRGPTSELALEVLAGPVDEAEAVGLRLALPAPRHPHLADYRVLMIDSHPSAAISSEVGEALDPDRPPDRGGRGPGLARQ